ncbi:tetratricopeptide repeat protein, partial [Kitasatospora sp. NPDC051853]|uniref:tetratricopeptide repeat protein n=1 Tax=Kitasatospora sp. NPDC051853 TaxID=3364058 RepID=UPI0037A13DC6
CAGCEVHVSGEDDLVELRELLADGVARSQLTRAQLIAKSGLSRTTIHEALQDGARVPSAATVAALAKALKMPDELLLKLRRGAVGADGGRISIGASGRPVPEGAGSGLAPLAPPPAVPGGFTGRDEDLEGLLELLAPAVDAESGSEVGSGAGAVVVASVLGMGGMGKTTLALALAHTALERGLFTGVLFLDLYGYDESPVDGPQALDTALRALDTDPERIPPETDQRAALYRSQLAARAAASERVLVLADNASDHDQVALLLPAANGPHRMLVTSRNNLAPDLGARLVDLDVLTPDNAVALMDTALRTVRRGDDRIAADPASAARVAELCGHLPLALRIAAAQLGRTLKPAQLAKDLEELTERLEVLEDRKDAVRTVLASSYWRLPVPQAELFRLLAVNPGPDISTETAAALTGIGKIRDVRKRLDLLADASLLRQDPDTERWRMHDLVRAYATEQAAQHPHHSNTALNRLYRHYLHTMGAGNLHLVPSTAGDRSRFTNRDAALAWLDAEHAGLVASVHHAHTNSHHHITTSLASYLRPYLRLRRHLQDAHDTATAAHQAATALGDRHSEGIAWNNLGNALKDLRRFDEAHHAHQSALDIYQDLGDRHGEAGAWNNLGNALKELRRFDEAHHAHQSALDIYQDLGDRHREAIAWGNLGSTLGDLRRFDEAHHAHQSALDIYQDLGDRHSEAIAWNNLGTALGDLRRFDEAHHAHRSALDIYQDLGDRHSEAIAWNNLGSALKDLRRFDEAHHAHRSALDIYQDLGDRHREAIAWNNLGNAARGLEEFGQAVEAGERAVAVFRDLDDLHRLGEASDELADTLLAAGRPAGEVRAVREAAADAYRRSGDEEKATEALAKPDE